jgi:hypothetical protein
LSPDGLGLFIHQKIVFIEAHMPLYINPLIGLNLPMHQEFSLVLTGNVGDFSLD